MINKKYFGEITEIKTKIYKENAGQYAEFTFVGEKGVVTIHKILLDDIKFNKSNMCLTLRALPVSEEAIEVITYDLGLN